MIPQDLLEHVAPCNGPIVHGEHLRTPLEWQVSLGLRGHGRTQKAERRFDVFAVDAVLFLVRDPTAIIDHTLQHQEGMATSFLDPGGRLDVLQIGGASVEMPAGIARAGLKPDDRWRPPQGRPIVAPALEIAVHRRFSQQPRRGLHVPVRRLDSIRFE